MFVYNLKGLYVRFISVAKWMNPAVFVLHKGPTFSNVMFVEKTDSVLGDGLSCLFGVENRLVSTRLEMSSSWISVMQATVDDSDVVCCWQLFHWSLSFFFFFPYLVVFWTCFLFLFRVIHEIDLKFLGFFLSIYQNLPFGIVLILFYVISLTLTYVKLWSLLLSGSGLTWTVSNTY